MKYIKIIIPILLIAGAFLIWQFTRTTVTVLEQTNTQILFSGFNGTVLSYKSSNKQDSKIKIPVSKLPYPYIYLYAESDENSSNFGFNSVIPEFWCEDYIEIDIGPGSGTIHVLNENEQRFADFMDVNCLRYRNRATANINVPDNSEVSRCIESFESMFPGGNINDAYEHCFRDESYIYFDGCNQNPNRRTSGRLIRICPSGEESTSPPIEENEPIECPTISAPSNGSQEIPTIVNIEWESVETAIGYKISIGTNENEFNILDDHDVGNITLFEAALPPNYRIYVKLTSYNNHTESENCSIHQFTTADNFYVCNTETEDEILFQTQEQIDRFLLDNEDCPTQFSRILVQEYFPGNITNLNGLRNINDASTIRIFNNTQLSDISGINSINNVIALFINNNNSIVEFPHCIQANMSNIGIANNLSLNDLESLSRLESLNIGMHIRNNGQITNVDFLSNLQSVGQWFMITRNENLVDISGIGNIDPLSMRSISEPYPPRFYIELNPQLDDCNIQSVCGILQRNDIDARINNNSSNCENLETVTNQCL